MALLHDDAKFVHVLGVALDSPKVRAAIDDWVTEAIAAGGQASGHDLRSSPALRQLGKVLASDQAVGPLTDAVVASVVPARNAAVAQLDAEIEPKRDVRVDLAPLFKAVKIPIDAKTAKGLGMTLKKQSLSVRLLTGPQLDTLQHRYDLTRLVATWAGWAGLVLLGISVASSAKPVRTLAIAGASLAALAVLAPYVLSRLGSWLSRGDLGPLLTPVLAAAQQTIGPYTIPGVVLGLVVAVAFGGLHLVLTRRSPKR